MLKYLIFTTVLLSFPTFGAEFKVINPPKEYARIVQEDVQLAYNFLKNCEYLQKKYPNEYKRLDQSYTVIEMPINKLTLNIPLCGMAVPKDNYIYIYPAAFTSEGCYKARFMGTLVHEMLHLIDLPNHRGDSSTIWDDDEIEIATFECWDRFTVD